jgi:DNA primase
MISQDDVFSYYRTVLPFIEGAFGGIPVVWATFAEPDSGASFHGPLRDRVHKLPTVDVRLGSRSAVPYFALQPKVVEWLIEYHHAVEFHSWTPTAANPQALRYARILLENNDTRDAAMTLREFLNEHGVRAIPLLDGNGGVALYLPFDDAPGYDDVRRWLHVVANNAAARRPDLFTTEPNSHGGSRVHVHVSHNAPGLYSALPYSLRGPDSRCAVAPLTWDELARLPANALQVETNDVLDRLHNLGDLFAAERDAIGKQRFTPLAVTLSPSKDGAQPVVPARGHVLSAAYEILSDGRSRSAEKLLKEGIARNLLAATTSYPTSTMRSSNTSTETSPAGVKRRSSRIPTARFASTSRSTTGPTSRSRRSPHLTTQRRRSSRACAPPFRELTRPPGKRPSATLSRI